MRELFDERAGTLRAPLIGIYRLLIAINLGVWGWPPVMFRQQPILPETAPLAYGFGLRHAVDADHIATIDNVTRELIQTMWAFVASTRV